MERSAGMLQVEALEQAAVPAPRSGTFDAILTPHRSLSPRGFLILMAAIGGLNFAMGVAFYLIGAWPVFAFCGLDVLIIYVAFRLNYRAARLHEMVALTPVELTITRVQPNGKRESWSFNPYWVRLSLERQRDERHQLKLRSHGKELTFGCFLSEEEKADFARAFSAALHAARSTSPA